MICEECGKVHVITGTLLVDGFVVPPVMVALMAEVLCKRGDLVEPEDEPDPGPPVPGNTKRPDR